MRCCHTLTCQASNNRRFTDRRLTTETEDNRGLFPGYVEWSPIARWPGHLLFRRLPHLQAAVGDFACAALPFVAAQFVMGLFALEVIPSPCGSPLFLQADEDRGLPPYSRGEGGL
jgi:hypothetical protein